MIGNEIVKLIKPSSIFLYIVIFCICIIYFRNINITLGIFVGIIFASICIYVLYINETTDAFNTVQLHKTKHDNIFPASKKLDNYTDLTDFVFSIQDFYVYNPQAYEDMVKSLDTFLEVYEDVLIDTSLAGQYFSIAETHKETTLNNLQSIIITIPPNKKLINKLNDALKIFEELLNKYLLVIDMKNKEYISEHGYFNNTKLIELNISPYNKYTANAYDKFY